MSRHRGHFFAEDILVAVHADLHGLEHGGRASPVASGRGTYPYDAPVPYRTLRPIRCTHPGCVHEATGRCTTCKRLYCVEHCRHLLVWAKDTRRECDRCAQHLSPAALTAPPPPASLAAVGTMIGFLLIISLGIAIDMRARGQGFIVLWIFAGAFFVLFPYMDR